MRRLAFVHRSWLWCALVIFLTARVSDAHVHLCFDGQEPATAVHMGDGSVHNDAHHADTEHVDTDVQVLDGVTPAKKVDESVDLSAIHASVTVFLLIADLQHAWRAASDDPAPAHPPFGLRPPVRGPPI